MSSKTNLGRHPGTLFSPSYLLEKTVRATLIRELESTCYTSDNNLKNKLTIIVDVGCGNKPYRDIYQMYGKYIGIDVDKTSYADAICKSEVIPIADDSVDIVVSTQALEHMENPSKFIYEALRILKPGGTLLITTHGLYPQHAEPFDYWRWTKAGLASDFRDFENITVYPVCGMLISFVILVNTFIFATLPRILKPRQHHVGVAQNKTAFYYWESKSQHSSLAGKIWLALWSPFFFFSNFTGYCLQSLFRKRLADLDADWAAILAVSGKKRFKVDD